MDGWTQWFGDEVKRLTNEACCKAVQKTGEVVLAAAKNEVPLDEGTLRDTGIVIMAAGNEPACCITFGGGQGTGFPIVPYAIRWHEHTANFQHGRKAFYLRDPFNRLAKNKLEDFMKEEMRNFL